MAEPHLLPGIAAVAVIGYLLGSLNFAIIVSRLFKGDDIRKHGSGNAGMTNILRTYGKGMAAATAAGDFLKAAVAIVLGRLLFARFGIETVDAGYIAGLFVLLGHLFPVYFRFRGGKGVMTTLGTIFCVDPLVFGIIVVLFVPVVFITRIVSLGSVLGALSFPFITYFAQRARGENPVYDTICAAVMGLIVLFMHRDNIKRLLHGTENKFGKPKQPPRR